VREGYAEENAFAFLGIEGKDPDQKKRSPSVFRDFQRSNGGKNRFFPPRIRFYSEPNRALV
jgi:hypothetical protein